MLRDKTRTPKNGYDFNEKQKYREDVWETFAKNLNASTAVVAFFPSKEGLEIPVALRLGFKEENLIAIDDAPAIIATSKWRKQYPGVRFYGNKLSRALERIAEDRIVLDAINMDFCNNLSLDLLDEISSVFLAGVIRDTCLLAYTIMSGRESRAVNTIAELLLAENGANHFKDKRLSVVQRYLGRLNGEFNDIYMSVEHEGEYKSGKLKMVYGILKWVSGEHLINSMLHELGDVSYLTNLYKVFCEVRDFVDLSKKCESSKHGAKVRTIEKQHKEAIDRYVSFVHEQYDVFNELCRKMMDVRNKYSGKRPLLLECCRKCGELDMAFRCTGDNFFNGYKRILFHYRPHRLPRGVVIER